MMGSRSPVDAAGRLIFSWPVVGVLVGALLVTLVAVAMGGHRDAFNTLLAVAAVWTATASAATWRLNRERLSAGVASRTERAREQAMFRDELDQRLQVQKLLRESDARLRAIVDSAPIALFATDRQGAITFCAGVGPDPLGKKPGEAVGWSAFELFADHAKVVECLRGALSGTTSQIDLALDERIFSLRLAPFRDASAKTIGGIVVAGDITDRHRAEVALRRTVETLKRIDGERRALLGRLVSAQEDERRRIAADIHDDSVQSMFAVAVRLLTLGSALHDPAQVDLVNRLQEAVRTASDRLRHLVFELRPAALDEGGLGAALREYLDVMREETGIEADLTTALPSQPASEIELIAYRIAQEALTNVRKHAKAKRVACEVKAQDGGILIRISDDGVGFAAGEGVTPPGHLGLVAMRERAEMAGGWLRVGASAGAGCTVEYWIPRATPEVANAA